MRTINQAVSAFIQWQTCRHLSARHTSERSAITSADAGLTLIELLVVLGILALVASIAGPQVLGYLGTAKATTARTQLNSLTNAVELYFLDSNAYPPQEIGLKALIETPPQNARWNGPYIKKEAALVDPWGRPYGYKYSALKGDFEIFSLGRDGVPGGGGEDTDISSLK
ncbi:type II secretion system major pseudopilin GspG [Hyphomicrobium sp.]|uniref:type II secretion system major pseudopilin GspG n=1 Tax=Hyphomicrobium sp. TaxID=82 RepID=UPI003F6F6950